MAETDNKILTKLETIERYSRLAAKNVLQMDEAAMLTGLSKSRLYYMTCKKQIPHYKGGGGKLVYFDKAELEAWMKQIKVPTVGEIEQEADDYCMKKKGGIA